MKSQCKVCGRNADSEYCFQHKPRKQLQKSRLNPTLSIKKDDSVGKTQQMRDFFSNIWKKRSHNSEVSGEYLGKEASSAYFHHILPKKKYPKAALDEENIILLTLLEHDNVENDIYKYEEVNRRREILKRKYNLT